MEGMVSAASRSWTTFKCHKEEEKFTIGMSAEAVIRFCPRYIDF